MNFDSPIYQCFVTDSLCKDLHEAGLTPHTCYHYKVEGNRTTLCTYIFDHDDYYANGDKLLDQWGGNHHIVPAYQLKDIEKILPGHYLLQRNEKGYELMLEDIYGLPAQTATRMPDVFALMIREGLKKRVIKLEHANAFITTI